MLLGCWSVSFYNLIPRIELFQFWELEAGACLCLRVLTLDIMLGLCFSKDKHKCLRGRHRGLQRSTHTLQIWTVHCADLWVHFCQQVGSKHSQKQITLVEETQWEESTSFHTYLTLEQGLSSEGAQHAMPLVCNNYTVWMSLKCVNSKHIVLRSA